MKKILLALLLVLTPFSMTSVYAADEYEVPVQKIEGAESPVGLGEVILLNVSKLAKNPEFLLDYSVEWKVFDRGVEKKFFTNSDGRGIFFGSGVEPRKVIVFASVSYLFGEKDADGKLKKWGVKNKFVTVIVDIGGSGPGPNPGPDPNPNPVDPTFPDGVFKLASKSYSFAKDKVASGNTRALAAQELAKSFSAQAAKIAAGQELTKSEDIKKVLEETTSSNQAALKKVNVTKEVWDAFFVSLQDEIYSLYESGKLKTKNDFVVAWKEISEGLNKVK
jgi:hypothetical protein